MTENGTRDTMTTRMKVEVGTIRSVHLEARERDDTYYLYARTSKFSNEILIGTYESFLEATQEFTVWQSAMKIQGGEQCTSE